MTHAEAIQALTECALNLPLVDLPDTQSWKWDKIATGLKDVTQALAVMFAGYFAYTRFIRGREHHESITVSVEGEVVTVADRKAIRVSSSLLNSGTFRMLFDADCEQTTTVYFLQAKEWRACELGQPLDWSNCEKVSWDAREDSDGFVDVTVEYEPGEGSSTHKLVTIPAGDFVACRIEFVVTGKSKRIFKTKGPWSWEASALVIEATDEGRPPQEVQGQYGHRAVRLSRRRVPPETASKEGS